MKSVLLSALIILALSANIAPSAELPSEFSYIIYVKGEPVGRSDSKVTVSDDAIVFESHTEIATAEFKLVIDSRTELDRETYLPRKFTFDGERQVTLIEGDVNIFGNEVTGSIGENGELFPVNQTAPHPQVLILEDYIMAHEVAVALAFKKTGLDKTQFGLIVPSVGRVVEVSVQKGSDLAFESNTKEAICEKLVVAIKGSSPFVSYFDPGRNMPVYLAFPGSMTEVFLDEFFDGDPVSRYRGP